MQRLPTERTPKIFCFLLKFPKSFQKATFVKAAFSRMFLFFKYAKSNVHQECFRDNLPKSSEQLFSNISGTSLKAADFGLVEKNLLQNLEKFCKQLSVIGSIQTIVQSTMASAIKYMFSTVAYLGPCHISVMDFFA